MKIFYSKAFLRHSLGPGHPESPQRLDAILKELEKEKYEIVEPKDINEEKLYSIHKSEYIAKLKDLCTRGTIYLDNIFSRETFSIAKLAAAAAKYAALSCGKEFSFALVRPPGHHAGKDFFGGFCYINNIAFAVRMLQKTKNVRKIMIIDFDYHAGNGTWDIFYEDPSVFYLSFHCDPRIAYPGIGFEHENTDHMVNVVLGPDTSDEKYVENFRANVAKYYNLFRPEAVAVSAGFDCYYRDPIAGLQIENVETYYEIGKIISQLRKPTFAILEGGYYLPKLGEMVKNFIAAFE